MSNAENTTNVESPKVAPFPGDLRDYFAAKAMQGMLSASALNKVATGELEDPTDKYLEMICLMAYRVADSMPKARKA